MSKSLFLRIVHRLSTEVAYFAPTQDAVGRSSLSPLQKCTAAIRQLAYGGGADTVDEYWKNCPTAWKGMYSRGTDKPTIVLEAVASYDLWIWHAFFGAPGTMNDLNILDRSPVFDDIIKGIAPQVNFNVNGREYDFAYYLTDGICPEWATFIQSIQLPQGPKHSLFAKTQESVRKDVERAFGVMQARFAVIKNPSNLWDKSKITNIMRACIILHNMIVEDERRTQTQDETFQDEDIYFCVKMPFSIHLIVGQKFGVDQSIDN
uniref:DDE Tnp4 domain-containing protein n=1 Tax=Brassica oleracea var. oleracea TaxID=109376 RepID=A0A0D2ZPG2_BRAOL